MSSASGSWGFGRGPRLVPGSVELLWRSGVPLLGGCRNEPLSAFYSHIGDRGRCCASPCHCPYTLLNPGKPNSQQNFAPMAPKAVSPGAHPEVKKVVSEKHHQKPAVYLSVSALGPVLACMRTGHAEGFMCMRE